MKKILLTILAFCSIVLCQAQTEGWQKRKPLNDDIPSRYASQMVSYNNKLYFFGGYTRGVSGSINDFWEYDPVTKKLTEQPALPREFFNSSLYGEKAVVIGDLIFLISGGNMYQYDFLLKKWSLRVAYPGASTTSTPAIAAIGNIIYVQNQGTFYAYNTTNNAWIPKANFPGTNRINGFLFSLNGKVYGGGGSVNNLEFPLTFFEYDPAADTWTSKANVPTSMMKAAALSSNGKGYVGFGTTINGLSTGLWYEYNPVNNTWTAKASGYNVSETSGSLINDNIYVFGGQTYSLQEAIVTRSFIAHYNTTNQTWSTDTLYTGGNRTSANGMYHNGKVYVAGGDDSEQRTDTWEYTIATDTWLRKANMPGSGFSLRAQAVIGSKMYILGGYRRGGSGSLPVYSNSVVAYDAALNTWQTKAPYPGGALRQIGAFVLNGELYAGCGWSGSPLISSTTFFKYNATNNTWTSLASCPTSGHVYASFAIGDVGYFIFGTNSTGTSIMYAYDRLLNTWTLKQALPDFAQGAGTSNVFVKDGNAYVVGLNSGGGGGFQYTLVRKYDPLTDKWNTVTRAPFFSNEHTVVNTGDDIYVGFGSSATPFPSSYRIENDWYKFSLQADVSNYVGDIVYNCSGSVGMATGESKTFTDEEGKLFVSLQGSATSATTSNMCISQRSLAANSPYREQKLIAQGNIPYAAMYLNKNFAVTSGGPSTGAKLRMYFTDSELNALVSTFNTKYGTSRTVNDIKILSGSNGSGVANLDPFDNISHTIYTPIVANYKTDSKYLEYTFALSEGIAEGYAVLLIPDQKITFPAITSKVYGTTEFASGAASTNSTTPITYTSSNSAVATVAADGKIKIVGVGTATITASQAGSSSFSAATPVSQGLTVTPAALNVAADNSTKIYGAANPAFTATYTGLVNGDNAASLTTAPTLTTTATAASVVNTYPITASGAASANYTITFAAGTLTINKAPLTVTAKNAVKVYDGASFTGGNGVDYTGFISGDNAVNSLTGTLAYTGTSQGAKNTGKYVITPSGYSAVNYTIAYANGELVIDPKAITVTADAKSKVYRQADPAFTYSLSSALIVGDSFSGAISRLAGENTGTYAIAQNTLTAGGNYSMTFVPANLIINKAALTITADNKSRVQGTANPTFTVSYTGFVNGETSTVLSTVPSLSTTATASSAPGTYPITASGAAALNYTIVYGAGTLTVTPSPPVVSAFTPTTSAAGATVTITGNYFTAATAVSFGGVPAASFTVVSPTSITAVVGAGASGNVSVTTGIGTGTMAGYIFVPRPTITAAGQTTFASGGSVVLTAVPGTGFAYKWAKNGVDIAGATSAAYTATTPGTYNVTITAGTASASSDAITVNVIFTLPATNFKLTSNGETCRTSNNGQLNITAVQNRSYTAVLTGNSLNISKPFTTTVDFTDLQAGTYNVCITVAGEAGYKQCFDVVITEPKDLSLYAAVQPGNKLSLSLGGGNFYNVELNGSVFQTSNKNVTLDLQPGENVLKIWSDKPCQGIIEKLFKVSAQPVVYPNPFESVLNISELHGKRTEIEIRSLDGQIASKQSIASETGSISLQLPDLKAGIYILKATSANKVYIYRIIKK